MKTGILCLLLIAAFAKGGEKAKNYTESLKKKLSKVDKIIVRDGGNTCCASAERTLKQDVYKEIKDKKAIKKLIGAIEFTRGRTENECMCCGHPGIDFYVGKERILISSWKHGYGLFTGEFVYSFTKKSKVNVAQWLVDNEIPDDNKEFKKILKEKSAKKNKKGDPRSPQSIKELRKQ